MKSKPKFTIVSAIKRIVSHAGLWFGENNNKIHILGKISIYCFLQTYVLQLIELFRAGNDIERIYECMSVIFFCGMGIIKLQSLHLNNEQWHNILTKITLLEKQQLEVRELNEEEYESDNEDSHQDAIDANISYTNKFKSTLVYLLKIYRFTVGLYTASPFLEYGLRTIFSNEALSYPHVLPSWNPLDNIHFICYLVAVLSEIVASLYCVIVHTAFDVAAIGIMVFVCGQYSLLFHRCTKIGGKGRSFILSDRVNARAHVRIIECHRTHVYIKELVNDLDKLLRKILGFYFFISTLTLCSVAVRLKSEHLGVMQLVSLLQYMGASLLQLFLFCNFGDALMNASSVGPGEGPFGASIWCLNASIRKEILLLGFGMLKAQRIHASPFNTVNLPTFIQIVRAAYSYYAVIGQK